MNLKSTLSLLAITLSLSLTACAGNDTDDNATGPNDDVKEIAPVEQMYNRAARALDQNNYNTAATGFDEVEQQYPYSQWATRAQLMSAYAHYRDMKYDNAIMALDRFIQLHPGNENIAYAYYLRALSFYEQISDVRRDQQMTQLALDGLRQVADRFPNTHYARDAKLKIDLTLDHLAGKEMEIGRYYLTRGQYQAAINRFQTVVDDYETTTHIPEA
ncbi:MAG: outer membrane protein assembly factor BamD, partial [Pseudomonadota bacterium]